MCVRSIFFLEDTCRIPVLPCMSSIYHCQWYESPSKKVPKRPVSTRKPVFSWLSNNITLTPIARKDTYIMSYISRNNVWSKEFSWQLSFSVFALWRQTCPRHCNQAGIQGEIVPYKSICPQIKDLNELHLRHIKYSELIAKINDR